MKKLTQTAIISAALLFMSGGAFAQQFTVEASTTKQLKVNGEVASIVIGNPRIADVAVQPTNDGNLILITGRTFGTTNLLIFNSDGKEVYSGDIAVTTNTANLVSVNRAGNTNTYDCAPRCRSVLAIGDENGYFGVVAGQSTRLQQLAEDAN